MGSLDRPGQQITERFWSALQLRDATTPGTPDYVGAQDRVERLARLMVDYDVRGEIPTQADLDLADRLDPAAQDQRPRRFIDRLAGIRWARTSL